MVSLHELTEPIYYGTLKQLQEPPTDATGKLAGEYPAGTWARQVSTHFLDNSNLARRTMLKNGSGISLKDITSAQRQLEETEQYRRDKTPGRTFMSFFSQQRAMSTFVSRMRASPPLTMRPSCVV